MERAMNDPRRVIVPWYSWRWRLGLLVPMALFGVLAIGSLRGFTASPFMSILFGTIFLFFAFLFARIAWRERYPLHSEVKRPIV